MATVPLSRTDRPNGLTNCLSASWVMGNADTGVPIEFGEHMDMTVQITGTFGSATIVIQGSNDGTTYTTLTDPQGNAISKTSAAIETIAECPRFVRPSSSGGTGTAVDVVIFARRGR